MSINSLSDDEYSLIRDYLILPFVKKMVKNNDNKIKETGMTLVPLFVGSLKKVLEMIDNDINQTRRQIAKLQAKITEVKRNDEGVLYEVRLRGYVHEIALVRHVVKREMANKRDAYIAMMFNI